VDSIKNRKAYEKSTRKNHYIGAKICLIARRKDELERVQQVIQQQGGQVWIYPVDITQEDHAKNCIEQILSEHAKVDVLINNAARSIRRPIIQALDRLHDFERTMQINYFAAVRLTLALLPHFLEKGEGHVVNISTMSTQVPIPLFSAYLASKPMSSKTTIYKHMRMLDTSTAAGWIVKAVQQKSYRITSTSGAIANALLNTAPTTVMNLTRPLFRLMDRRLEKKLKDKSS